MKLFFISLFFKLKFSNLTKLSLIIFKILFLFKIILNNLNFISKKIIFNLLINNFFRNFIIIFSFKLISLFNSLLIEKINFFIK